MKKLLTLAFLISAFTLISQTAFAGDCFSDPVYDRNWNAEVTTGAFVRDVACMEGSEVLTTATLGSVVHVIAETDGWYQIELSDGTIGWVGQWLITETSREFNASEPAPYAPMYDIAGHKYESAIWYIYFGNIVQGYEDGSYQPDRTLNRAELLKIILESAYDVDFEPYSNESCFTDIDPGQWYTKYICFAKAQNIIKGYGDNTFKPAQDINFAEALKITLIGFGYEYVEETPWYKNLVNIASEKNYIPLDVLSPYQSFTRGQMADLITRISKDEAGQVDAYLGDKTEYKVTFDTLESNTDVEALYLSGEAQDEVLEVEPVFMNLEDWLDEEELLNESLGLEQYKDQFVGTEGDPQFIPTPVAYSLDSMQFEIEMTTTGSLINDVQVLLFDLDQDAWVPGVDSGASPHFEETVYTDFSSIFSLEIEGTYVDDDNQNALYQVDPSMGYLLMVTVDDGSSFLLTINDSVEITGDDIQTIAEPLTPVSILSEDCACPDVSLLSQLQSAFTNHNATADSDNFQSSYTSGQFFGNPITHTFNETTSCGDTSSTYMRLGETLNVLESMEKVQERMENDEPSNSIEGAFYQLYFSVRTYCGTDCKCKCTLSYRVVNVETSVIESAKSYTSVDCDPNLTSSLTQMLTDIETDLGMQIH